MHTHTHRQALQVILYSALCNLLHWTDNKRIKVLVENLSLFEISVCIMVKVVLLGRYNAQGLDNDYELLIRVVEGTDIYFYLVSWLLLVICPQFVLAIYCLFKFSICGLNQWLNDLITLVTCSVCLSVQRNFEEGILHHTSIYYALIFCSIKITYHVCR